MQTDLFFFKLEIAEQMKKYFHSFLLMYNKVFHWGGMMRSLTALQIA